MSLRVQERSVYPGTSLAYSASPTAGNLLVVWLVWHTGTLTGVSGSLNGAFTLSSTFGTGFTFCAMAYKFNCLGGAETISTAGTNADMGFTIYEFSGIQTSSDPLDGSIVATVQSASTTTPVSASFSTSATGLIVVGLADEGTTPNTPTQGSGYTLGESQPNHFHADEYALSVAPGSHTAGFTLTTACSGSPDCLIVVACFKDAAGAATALSAPLQFAAPVVNGVRPVVGMMMRALQSLQARIPQPVVTQTFIYRMHDLDGLTGQGATMKNQLE